MFYSPEKLVASYGVPATPSAFVYNALGKKSLPTKDLSNMLVFSSFFKEHYPARYRKIIDMDTLFAKMPVQNFKWFHCNIALLANEIYQREQGSFIRSYLQLFPPGNQRSYSTGDVIELLDEKTGGLVGPWAKELEVKRR